MTIDKTTIELETSANPEQESIVADVTEINSNDNSANLRLVPDPEHTDQTGGIALALGGGAARGWAHIGVLRAIDEAKIPVSMIAGTSIGALVGGCYLAGKLDELEDFARSITRTNVLRYMDFALRASGIISGKRLAAKMEAELEGLKIEDLSRPFVAIATDIENGHEVWLETGDLVGAIRSSYALPGVFKPVDHFGKHLVDGALVNPVPVSACRAHEQKIVVAINLDSEVFGRSTVVRSGSFETPAVISEPEANTDVLSWLSFGFAGSSNDNQTRSQLGVMGVMIEAFNIIQNRIVRSRLAGDPPDIIIRPKLKGIGLADFHKADQAISEGYELTRARIAELESTGFRDAL